MSLKNLDSRFHGNDILELMQCFHNTKELKVEIMEKSLRRRNTEFAQTKEFFLFLSFRVLRVHAFHFLTFSATSVPSVAKMVLPDMNASMLAEAWVAMGANRLRTFLTMLGMVIGVAAVIRMLAIGQGAQMTGQQDHCLDGQQSVHRFCRDASTSRWRRASAAGSATTLTIDDAAAMSELPTVGPRRRLSPAARSWSTASNNWSTQVNGVTPDYFEVRDWQRESRRRSVPTADMRDPPAASRCSAQTVARESVRRRGPGRQTIRIRNSPYLVVGVLARKGQSLDGRDQDDTVLVPVTTAQRKLFGTPFRRHGALHPGAGGVSGSHGRSGKRHHAAAAPAPPHPATARTTTSPCAT